MKIQKKNWGGGGHVGGGGSGWGGGQGGCDRSIEVFGKIHKKKKKFGGGGGREGGSGWGSGWWGVRVDVNAMLGLRGDVGCGPRIDGIVQCTKRYCTILRKFKKCGGGGGGRGRGNI